MVNSCTRDYDSIQADLRQTAAVLQKSLHTCIGDNGVVQMAASVSARKKSSDGASASDIDSACVEVELNLKAADNAAVSGEQIFYLPDCGIEFETLQSEDLHHTKRKS